MLDSLVQPKNDGFYAIRIAIYQVTRCAEIREKIGIMFGNPETTTGGNALKFYSSVRLDIRRIGSIKDGDEIVGNDTRVKVIKNKP